MEIAVLALGCFWEPEIKFGKLKGILRTEVGYCGGNSPKITYKEPSKSKSNAKVLELTSQFVSYSKTD